MGIVLYDIRALAAKFQRDLLQVRCAGGLHDFLSGQDGARKCHFVNARMTCDGLSDCRTITSHDVDYAWWEPGSLDELASTDRSKRSNFGWFDDDGITTRKC